MQMDAGLDTGDTVLLEELEIAPNETSVTLHDRLAALGAKLIVNTLAQLGGVKPLARMPQSNIGITYAEKILKAEAEIDWSLSAKQIDARIRAFNPFPGASSSFAGHGIKFWNSCMPKEAPSKSGLPGEVLGFIEESIYVQCGSGVLEVIEMQKPGGKRMNAKLCLQTFDVAEKPFCFKTKVEQS